MYYSADISELNLNPCFQSYQHELQAEIISSQLQFPPDMTDIRAFLIWVT